MNLVYLQHYNVNEFVFFLRSDILFPFLLNNFSVKCCVTTFLPERNSFFQRNCTVTTDSDKWTAPTGCSMSILSRFIHQRILLFYFFVCFCFLFIITFPSTHFLLHDSAVYKCGRSGKAATAKKKKNVGKYKRTYCKFAFELC